MACLGTVLAFVPKSVSAHGAEYVFAKLTVGTDRRCTLEVTADYMDNPMIHGEADARTVIADLLSAQFGEASPAPEPMGEPKYEERQQFDPTTPAWGGEAARGQSHHLLTAIWRWKSSHPSVFLQMSSHTPFDALFWTVDSTQPVSKIRWTLLVPGDRSPTVTLPQSYLSAGAWTLCGLAMTAALLVLLRRRG